MVIAFRAFWKVYIFVYMAEGAKERVRKAAADAIRKVLSEPVPQDNIIEAQEAEIARLKTDLAHTQDRLSKMREKFDELKVILRET